MTESEEERELRLENEEEACLENLELSFNAKELAKMLWEKMTALEKNQVLQEVYDEWESEKRQNASP